MHRHVITVYDVLFIDLRGEKNSFCLVNFWMNQVISVTYSWSAWGAKKEENIFFNLLWKFDVLYLFVQLSCEVNKRPFSFWFVVTYWTDSAAAAAATAAAVEKMIMVYNQELFWCNGVPTKHDKALKWIQSLRGTYPTNKQASRPGSRPTNGHLTSACKLCTQPCWPAPHINASLIAIW